MHRELDVRPARVDADRPDAGDRRVAHDLVLLVGERLRRRHGDRVAGVHAHRVEVLDRAHDDDVVPAVAHHLELELLPARDRLLDQDLVDRRGLEAPGDVRAKLLVGGREAAARATERARGPDDERQAEVAADRLGFLRRAGVAAARQVEADRRHGLLEEIAVLGAADRVDARADQLDAVALQHSCRGEVEGEVEARLPADGGEKRVGLLRDDDAFEHLDRHRLDVGAVGELRVGHDGGRVRVDEDDAVALFAKGLARLRAGVVELARLADDDGAGADEEDRADVGAAGHPSDPAPDWPDDGETAARFSHGRTSPGRRARSASVAVFNASVASSREGDWGSPG